MTITYIDSRMDVTDKTKKRKHDQAWIEVEILGHL